MHWLSKDMASCIWCVHVICVHKLVCADSAHLDTFLVCVCNSLAIVCFDFY